MNTTALPIVNVKNLIVGLVMLAAAGLAIVLTPKQMLVDQGPKIDLETMIPRQFGTWQVEERVSPVLIAPDLKAKLDQIYSQTFSQTYFNAKGERVMLSLAYGGNQKDGLQVHKPEVCYPAQGFEVLQKSTEKLTLTNREIPVVRLLTKLGPRLEPITYWITVGDKVPGTGIEKKIEKIFMGLSGNIPDGMLVRVSNIGTIESGAYQLHGRFIEELLAAVTPEMQIKLAGQVTK